MFNSGHVYPPARHSYVILTGLACFKCVVGRLLLGNHTSYLVVIRIFTICEFKVKISLSINLRSKV